MADDLAQVLVNVRRAYRLLNAYHRRVLHTIPRISEKLGKEFEYWYGDPEWRARASNSGVFDNPLGLNPIHCAGFVFRPADTLPQAGEWLLEVKHVGDSAYDNADNYDPAALAPAEQMRSEIYLSAALVMRGAGSSWYELWNNCSYPEDAIDDTIDINGTVVWQGNADGCDVRVFRKNWSVAEFADEQSVNARCEEFRQLVAAIAAA